MRRQLHLLPGHQGPLPGLPSALAVPLLCLQLLPDGSLCCFHQPLPLSPLLPRPNDSAHVLVLILGVWGGRLLGYLRLLHTWQSESEGGRWDESQSEAIREGSDPGVPPTQGRCPWGRPPGRGQRENHGLPPPPFICFTYGVSKASWVHQGPRTGVPPLSTSPGPVCLHPGPVGLPRRRWWSSGCGAAASAPALAPPHPPGSIAWPGWRGRAGGGQCGIAEPQPPRLGQSRLVPTWPMSPPRGEDTGLDFSLDPSMGCGAPSEWGRDVGPTPWEWGGAGTWEGGRCPT